MKYTEYIIIQIYQLLHSVKFLSLSGIQSALPLPHDWLRILEGKELSLNFKSDSDQTLHLLGRIPLYHKVLVVKPFAYGYR